jgi:hypothetical protein
VLRQTLEVRPHVRTKRRQILDTHERLRAGLAELNQIRPAALLSYERLGQSLRFRAGLPYLDRTFEIFHRLYRRDLTGIPLDLLRSITDDACATLDKVRGMTALADEQAENFDEALEGLINEVKGSYDRISANVARAISQRQERSPDLTKAAVALAVVVFVAALAILASNDKTVGDALLRAAHRIGTALNQGRLSMSPR